MSNAWEAGMQLSEEELEERYAKWIQRVERDAAAEKAAKPKVQPVIVAAWSVVLIVAGLGVGLATYGVLEFVAWVVE